MPESSASRRFDCPKCGQMVLSEDKFCFHCGRRLQPKDQAVAARKPRAAWWPAGILAALILVAAGYEIHHQSVVIAGLKSRFGVSLKSHHLQSGSLHPVVTTTTSYPPDMPSSANWSSEVKTYAKVQFGIRVPNGMDQALHASSSRWAWGEPHSPYEVSLSVVGAKSAAASTVLGSNTYGTPISRGQGTASQQLYVNWASHEWLLVSMTVPANHEDWLEAIATSVQISS